MKFVRYVVLCLVSFLASPDLVFAQTTVDLPGIHVSAGDDGVVVSLPGVSVNTTTQPSSAHSQNIESVPQRGAPVVPNIPVNQSASYVNAQMPGMDFSNKNLLRANFTNAVLSGAVFRGSQLSGAEFTNAHLDGADFSGAQLSHADLVNADLSHANLTNADLSGADLTNATFNETIITGARFDGADLSNVDMDKVIRTVGVVPASRYQPVPSTPASQATESNLTGSSGDSNESEAPARKEFIEKLGMAMAGTFFSAILLVLIVLLGGVILVIVRCIKNKDLSNPKKIAWVLLTFFFPPGSYIMMFFVEKKVKWKIVAVILFLISAGATYVGPGGLLLLLQPR